MVRLQPVLVLDMIERPSAGIRSSWRVDIFELFVIACSEGLVALHALLFILTLCDSVLVFGQRSEVCIANDGNPIATNLDGSGVIVAST